ncbi:hypothetical protein [Botrimarina hoheduenensis]|uniref:Uncharacterized protein n=1 Tax=Botrimarina hoheduenensis TaxID=2528000 RepID=A0A5C5WDV5_9BACT|nr:hypothetical protein [Botrimarina hoheduenensis]TWT48637.1 hypothetical protein Pla111_04120 [Botrimarina hoheduenensis]
MRSLPPITALLCFFGTPPKGAALWLAAGIGLLISPPTAAEVLLMRHGDLLQGQIEPNAGGWIVRTEGEELRVPGSSVVGRFRDARDAYRWLAADLLKAGGAVDRHATLSEWCLRQQLFVEANEQLQLAEKYAQDYPRLEPLRRRIAMGLATPRLLPPVDGAESLGAGERVPSTKRSRVEQATFEAPITDAPANGDPSAALETSEASLQQFTRRIQPLLVNNCTAGGCHRVAPDRAAPNHQTFALDRRLLFGYSDSRSTSLNLRSVLAAIDPNEPHRSPLLAAARGPHAGGQPFRGPRRDDWIATLEQWVKQVARDNQTEAAEPAGTDATTDPMTEGSPVRYDSAVMPAALEEPITSNRLESDPLEETYAPRQKSALKIGRALERVEPRDEFDPEIFNRTYRQPADGTIE